MGSWNVLSLSDDYLLPHLSDKLSRQRADMLELSETRMPGCGETSSKVFIYFWSCLSNGHCVKGIAISRLQPSVVEVIIDDECIM